tara:strand:+ start:3001 stop:3624 length:624 start_codon:yes stop_codon:yes gene_type:complete
MSKVSGKRRKVDFAKRTFTTGDVAIVCSVSLRAVSRWFDSGRLQGYRIPGSRDRRIPREHLIRFLRQHGLEVPRDLEDMDTAKIIIFSQDEALAERIERELFLEESLKVVVEESAFGVGTQAVAFKPDCIVVDFSVGEQEALNTCRNIRGHKNEDISGIILIALLPDDGSPRRFGEGGINETFKKPFDSALLAERLRTLIRDRKALV